MSKKIIKIISALLILGALAVLVLFLSRVPEITEEIVIEYSDSIDNSPMIIREYGLRVDSFHIINGIIKRDQTLSLLLQDYGISNRTIYQLDEASKGIFDVRKIRRGNPFKLFCTKDSLDQKIGKPQGLSTPRFGIPC